MLDGITHMQFCYVQQEKESVVETLEIVVGHRGCCHNDSNGLEPMAAQLSLSAF